MPFQISTNSGNNSLVMDSSPITGIPWGGLGLSVSEMLRLLLYPASATQSMLTFKLVPRCGPGDEQKCQCVMTNKQCLHPFLIPLFIGPKKKNAERSICILEKRGLENPGRTQRTAGVTLGKCDIVPQIKVNPSKATRFSLLLSVNSLPRARIQAQRPFVV